MKNTILSVAALTIIAIPISSMVGVSYAIDAHFNFFGTGDAAIQGADFSVNSNDLMVGIRYNF